MSSLAGRLLNSRLGESLAERLPSLFQILRAARHPSELAAAAAFLRDGSLDQTLSARVQLLRRFFQTTCRVASPHRNAEILAFVRTILALPAVSPGVVVEAGCFQGSGTAKFSLAAQRAGRQLVVFDSFRGLPENDEAHDKDIFGGTSDFQGGNYRGSLDDVRRNVATFGHLPSCRFVEGWFEDTLPDFHEVVAAVYLDVDLASSTRTCLKYLFPLLNPGGVLYSQDGHVPLVLDVFRDERFWEDDVGCAKPVVEGLGRSKLLKIVKGSQEGRERLDPPKGRSES